MSRRKGLFALVILVVSGACAKSRDAQGAPVAAQCTTCHGGLENGTGAPPNDVAGRTATSLMSVGAHTVHVTGGALAPAFDCSACHVKPAYVGSPGHLDNQATLTWSALATASGTLSPVFDPGAGTCANVYCHGSFPGGNGSNHPVWTQVGAGAACGSCHTIPPPPSSGHPQKTTCGDCHGGYTSTSVNVATHVNGKIDVLPIACSTCHGDASRAATALNPQLSAAPPTDTQGNTSASSPGVGAHQAHLSDGALRGAIACTECHAVPASLDGHPIGTVDLTWGTLARTGGAAPSWNGTALTCANYCHGSTIGAGGTNHAPRWTGGAGEAACGTCHGAPPPTPHPQNASCGKCHLGYTSSTVNVATHINGVPDIDGMSCSSCHGDPARAPTTANPQLAAAPPVDTTGGSDPSAPGVGAHQAHLNAGALRGALACTDCHPVPTSLGHANGTVDFAWSALATASGATVPALNPDGSCSSTYCHGATLAAGGTNQTPLWTGGAAEAACGTCHGLPPPAASGHTQSTRCGGCHLGYTISSVNAATHVDGRVQVTLSCSSCHGDTARADTTVNPRLSAAPPADTAGNTDPTAPGVGAHQAHLQDGSLRIAIACTECHAVPASLTSHPTGTTTFSWGPLATGNGATTPAYAGGSCATTYCHGSTLGAGGTNHTPAWTGGAAEVACGTCHGAPPAPPHPQTTACGGCHGAGYGATSVNPATHVNGTVELLPFTCTSCHGDPARADTTLNPRLSAAPPFDTHGGSSPAEPGVGAHQVHLSDGPLRDALACTDCHVVPTSVQHPNGTVELSWSALATANGATTPSFTNGTCASTYCHGSTIASGGSNHTPAWTGGAAEAACGTCHGAPPPLPHPQNINCASCHGDGYSLTTVDPATHVNGQLDVGPLTCTSCHGDPTRAATPQNPLAAAPPVDTFGQTSSPRVGAHQIHLVGSALRGPIDCTECHAVPQGFAGHPNGVLDLPWGPLATGALTATVSTDPAFGGFTTTSPQYAGGSCSATYCHGSYSGTFTYRVLLSDPAEYRTAPYAGLAAAPSWTGTAACGSCHGAPPAATNGGWHSHSGPQDCSTCHPDAAGLGTAASPATITNLALHVDGKVDVVPKWSGTCIRCH